MAIEIYQANTRLIPVTVTDETGLELDITGAALEYNIKTIGGREVVSKSVGAGITITNGVLGQCEVLLTPTDTALPFGQYVHELKVTTADGAFTVFHEDLTILYSTHATI